MNNSTHFDFHALIGQSNIEADTRQDSRSILPYVRYSVFVFLQVLRKLGYQKLLLQIGRGEIIPNVKQTSHFSVEHYRYKDSIKDDIQKTSLVISHAGITLQCSHSLIL